MRRTAFTVETAPRQGGKKGRRFKHFKTRAKEKVDGLVEEMFAEMDKMAAANVLEALRKKNAKVSMWYLDQRAKQLGTRLPSGLLRPLIQAVETLEDAELISKQALLLAIDGEMSFEQLKAVQEAVARHSTLSGLVALRELRSDLDAIRNEEASGAARKIGMTHAPVWGRLRDDPVEDAEIEPTAKPNGNGAAKPNGSNGSGG